MPGELFGDFVDPRSRAIYEVHKGDLFRVRSTSGSAIVRASDKMPSGFNSITIVFTVVTGHLPPGPVFGKDNSFQPIDEPTVT